MHFQKVPHYGQFRDRIKAGKKPCIVRMALIRKVLVSAYYVLTRKQPFRWVDQKSYATKLHELNSLVRKFEKTEHSGLLREAS
jgi:hypothetical protein